MAFSNILVSEVPENNGNDFVELGESLTSQSHSYFLVSEHTRNLMWNILKLC